MAFFQGTCLQCGEDFQRRDIPKHGVQTFCSIKCYSDWRKSRSGMTHDDTRNMPTERCRIPLCESGIDEGGMCGYHHERYKWVLEMVS